MNYTGWLAPNGKHIECDNYGHDNLTWEILKKYYKIEPKKITVLGREDILFEKGWCRIGFSSVFDYGYVIQAKWRYITEEQKLFIQNMYFDIGDKMTATTIANLVDYDIIELSEEQQCFYKRLSRMKYL